MPDIDEHGRRSHPPPWTTQPAPPESQTPIISASGERVVASDGREPIWGEVILMGRDLPTGVMFSNPYVRELVLRAPEMEAALRMALEELREYGRGHAPNDNGGALAAARILAALDEARVAKGPAADG